MKILMSVPYQNSALSIQHESLVIILSSGAQTLLEVISVRVITWISLYTTRSKARYGTRTQTFIFYGYGNLLPYVLPKIQS